MRIYSVSAVHDLEEEMDSSPSLPVEAPQQHKIAKVQNSKKHETMSSQHRTRSAGSTSRTSTTSEGFPPATVSATADDSDFVMLADDTFVISL